MTRSQESYLSVAKNVPQLMREYGFEFAGPNTCGAYLFNEPNGRAWLLTDFRGKVAPVRMILPSVWSEQNISVMGGVR